jgi:hypothetical protein
MYQCANCDASAEFNYAVANTYYCSAHLPSFLRLPNNEHLANPMFVAEAALVEEPVVEVAVTKSSKKATSKATAEETTAPAEEPTP